MTIDLPLLLTLFAAAATLGSIGILIAGSRAIGNLADVPIDASDLPPVTIVVPALNEASGIEEAMRSLLALDYPALQIIAINDRSTDATPSILNTLAEQTGRLTVLHVERLAPGWLGKNHALHLGSLHARGEYLLFTDADVVFQPEAIARAVSYCRRNRLDHLCLFPRVPANDALLAMLLLQFAFAFALRFQPWKIRRSPKHFLGQGAFNLVRRDAYLHAGGHAAIPLAVIDDMMLGWLIKRHGFTQDVLFGQEFLSVRWYGTAGEMFRGLQKNMFAGFDFSVARVALTSLLLGVVGVWPWIGLAMTSGATAWLNLSTITILGTTFAGMARLNGWSLTCLFYLPAAVPLTLAMWWQACLTALQHGGIQWRGTFYSLADLKKAHKLR